MLDQLNSGTYNPDPVKQYVRYRSPGSKEQKIGILSIRDRIVQQALVSLLSPLFEPDFLDCSYAYRRGRSALLAADRVQELIKSENYWVLETDIASFFDSLDHDYLLKRLSDKVNDDRILQLVSSYIKAPQFHEMTFSSPETGISIGSIISPLLSNIYLHTMDIEMTRGNYSYIRYSDDLVVLGLQKEEMKQALHLIKSTLKRIKLNINKEKTHIRHVSEGFEFLGYYFDQKGRGPASKAIEALHQNISIIYNQKKKTEETLNEMQLLLQGWSNYYGGLSWLMPQEHITLLVLTRLAVAANDLAWAEKLLSLRPKIEENDANLCYLLAKEWYKLGWVEDALLEIGRALILDKDHTQTRNLLFELAAVDQKEQEVIIKQLLNIAEEPGYVEGYHALSETFMQNKHYKLAQSMYARAVALENDYADNISTGETFASETDPKNIIDLNEKEISLFLNLFTGREDIYAFETPGSQKQRNFTTIKGTLSADEVKRHLAGEITLASYLIRENHTIRLMVIDIDVSKKLLLENEENPEAINDLIDLTQIDANRLKSSANAMGINVYLEDSGYRGRHCWFFFEEPISAKKARALGALMMRKTGASSGGITWELFPGSDRLKNTQSLHRIKLPLGVHPVSGRRALFLDETGSVYPEQGLYLEQIKPVSLDIIERNLAEEETKNESKFISSASAKQILEKETALTKDVQSRIVREVVKRCSLIRYFIQKAESTNYLPHGDRQVLLYVLAHLGDEGKKYLHQVMACCLNYKQGVTQKHIDRLPGKPISCGRLRERYPQLSTELKCNCRFKRLPDTYPSPVLHAVNKNELPPKAVKMPLVENALPHEITSSTEDEIENVLKKMRNLRRQQENIGKSLEKCEQLLEKYFDEKQIDSLSVEAGNLVRLSGEDGKIKWVIEI